METYGASYRSVAFGTWKVGEARRFTAERFAKRHRTPDPIKDTINCQQDKSNTSTITRPDTYKSQPKLHSPDLEFFKLKHQLPVEPQSSKSQPCSPAIAKRPLKKQARLAEPDDEDTMSTSNGPPNGDCYSSTEYVQFSTARNAYENVLVGVNSPLQRQSLLLNRSMDALNERIVHYRADQPPLCYNDGCHVWSQEQPGTSHTNIGNMRGTLGRNWRVRTPMIMPREYVVDPGPLYSTHNAYTTSQMNAHQLEQQKQRYRAKSLDNTNRVNTTTFPTKIKRAGSNKQPEDLNNKSALQSAKNFLRRLYNTSTLRLRGAARNGRKMDAEQRFQMAMAPFYEPRRPDFNERPFLPYNVRYEIEDEEDEGNVYDTHVLSTPASSASSATTANNSPDEGIDGMFSAEESASSTRSSAVSSTNGIISARAPLHNNCLYHHRPGSGLSSSTVASSSGLNSTFSSAFMPENSYSSSKRQAPIVERFRNWNDLFEHLKKEMSEIRARDNQILHDLKRIEEEVNVVKQLA